MLCVCIRNVTLSLGNGPFVSLPDDSPLQKQCGSVSLHWDPTVNTTRQNLHQSVHYVSHSLRLEHKNYQLYLYSVHSLIKGNRFFFVDMQMNWKVHGEICYEGVWGRTTCQPSL